MVPGLGPFYIYMDNTTLWLVWPGAIWLLWWPGIVLTHLLRLPRSRDILVQFALQIGLGLAFWPILFLWTSTLGWQLSAKTAQTGLLLFSLVGLLLLTRSCLKRWRAGLSYLRRSAGWLALFGIIAALTILTRLLHIRHVVLPVWVDSVTHTMIVRVLLLHGALPETFAPFLPTIPFTYHWGYHATTMWLAWFLGQTEPVATARLVLQFGQVLNALTVPILYAAGRTLFNSRRTGLLVAGLAALVSWMPAYYVSLGRYTQLTGLLILPIFGLSLWRLHTRPTWGGWLALILLGAGLLLTHARVAVYALTLAMTLAIPLLIRRNWPILGLWLLAAVATMLLTLPWLPILAKQVSASPVTTAASSIAPTSQQAGADYSHVPLGLLWIPHNPELLALATGGVSGLIGWGDIALPGKTLSGVWLCLLLGLLIRELRRYHLDQAGFKPDPWAGLGLLLGWCVLTTLLITFSPLNQIGGLLNWAISGVIALFVPLSLTGGCLLAWVSGQLTPRRWVGPATALLILAGSGWGASTMRDIINPITILAKPKDIQAMTWIRANTPAEAYFAINVWPWFHSAYIGSDGGYWIATLTDRRSILPATIYNTAEAPSNLLSVWAKTSSLDDPAIRAHLRAVGITHIYLGARGGHLVPEQLLNRPFVELIYQDEPVYIFKLKNE